MRLNERFQQTCGTGRPNIARRVVVCAAVVFVVSNTSHAIQASLQAEQVSPPVLEKTKAVDQPEPGQIAGVLKITDHFYTPIMEPPAPNPVRLTLTRWRNDRPEFVLTNGWNERIIVWWFRIQTLSTNAGTGKREWQTVQQNYPVDTVHGDPRSASTFGLGHFAIPEGRWRLSVLYNKPRSNKDPNSREPFYFGDFEVQSGELPGTKQARDQSGAGDAPGNNQQAHAAAVERDRPGAKQQLGQPSRGHRQSAKRWSCNPMAALRQTPRFTSAICTMACAWTIRH